jgi:zinc protease
MTARRHFVVAAFVLALVPLRAQAPLETDPAIRSGSLANGLQYFLQPNPRQRDRMVIELVVKAGSIDETDEQRGVAHLVEHMAFNGSTHFKSGEMAAYFQSIGARLGAHVNAQTTYDSTTYVLDVPLDKDGTPGRAFDAVRDIAGGLTFDEREFERERNVVIEEWRGRLGVTDRQRQPQLLALFGPSKYAERRVIGDPDRFQSITVDRLRDFYREHYRADRMALIAVGGAGSASLEALLHASFDDLSRQPSRPRELPQIPDHAATRYAVFTDSEAQATTVGVTFTRPALPVRSVDDFRRVLVQSLAINIMGARFAELSRRPGAPFLSVATGRSPLVAGADTLRFIALVTPENSGPALAAILQEIVRAREHGFTVDELERARAVLNNNLRQTRADNRGIADILASHYLRDEPAPAPRQLLAAGLGVLPQVTLDELRQTARNLWSDTNRVVSATAASSNQVPPATDTALQRIVNGVATAPTLPPWQPSSTARSEPAALPPPGVVESRRELSDVGVTILTLSNGVEVWLKPTSFNPGEIIFRAQAPGGAALATPATFPQAMLSAGFVAGAGVGGVAPDVRGRELAGRPVQVRPVMAPTSQAIAGTMQVSQLETALDLARLYFTAQNRDAAELARQKTLAQTALANQDNSPAFAFASRLREVNTGDFYMMRPPTAADLARVDPAAAVQFFADRFSNAANFTFFLAGSFTVDSITPLLEKYVGSLPSKKTRDLIPGAPAPEFPKSVVRETIRKGRDPRSQTAITFFADTELDPVQIERASAVAAVLQTRLYARLRTLLGGTYTVGSVYSDTTPQRGFGTITVTFGSAPANAEALTTAALDEIGTLRTNGPTAAEVDAVKTSRLADLRSRLTRNDYWVDALARANALGRDASSVTQEPQRIETALTVEGVAEAARRYLPSGRYTVLTLLPED